MSVPHPEVSHSDGQRDFERGEPLPVRPDQIPDIEESYVSSEPVTHYVGGTGTGNYTTINDAFEAAKDNDIIYVYSGTYDESLSDLDKPVKIIGENKYNTIITGGNNSERQIFDIDASDVTISGFTFQYNKENDNESFPSSSTAISVSRYNNTISNNIINGEFTFAIYISNLASHSVIFNNKIINSSQSGIEVDGSNNIIHDNYLESCNYSSIFIDSSSQNKIFQNTIKKTIRGVYIRGDSVNNSIYKNTIEEAELGICIYSYYILDGSPINNVIYHNNLLNNTYNCYDVFNNNWYNSSINEGNYWDDYNGNDTDNDSIGDESYIIPGGNNQDKYPLMTPYKDEFTEEKHDDNIDISSLYPILIIIMIAAILFCLLIGYYVRKKRFT
jgi:parallel beta-helix repeat protein